MDTQRLLIVVRGLAGGLVGGVAGYFVFQWLLSQRLYGIMIPGALIGLGAGLAARGRSTVLGVLCCLGAVALMIYAEWTFFDLRDDETLVFLLTHLHQKSPAKLVMMAVGAALAYWLGQGR